jgi:hypothetical protein
MAVFTHRRALILLLAAVVASCGGSDAPEPPSPSIRLDGLDLILSPPPTEWRIDDADDVVRFEPATDGVAGRLRLFMADPGLDTNLVAAAEAHRRQVEAEESSRYFGRQELVTQLGTAFTSRAERDGESDGPVGETLVFALHPRRDGMICLEARYPADDDPTTRVSAAIEVFSLIE